MTKMGLTDMLEKGAGSIVKIASVVSSEKAAPRRFAYGASKAAIIGTTTSIAADHVNQGIRCGAICSGTVQRLSLEDRVRATGDLEKALAVYKDRQPMCHHGQPEDMAELVCCRASDMAGFTTGQALSLMVDPRLFRASLDRCACIGDL